MKRFIPGPLTNNARGILRTAGYGELRTRQGQVSFTRRIRGTPFPRFHAYVEDRDSGMQINLHLDQKEHGLGGGVHQGEYEGPLLDREMQQILSVVTSARQQAKGHTSENAPQNKRGFWASFFGG